MAHPESVIPQPETYNRVLRRYDRDPRHAHQQTFVGYDVSLRAVACEMAETGLAMTLFFPHGKEAAADRALRSGWKECTGAWRAALAGPPGGDLRAARRRFDAMTWHELRAEAKRLEIPNSKSNGAKRITLTDLCVEAACDQAGV